MIQVKQAGIVKANVRGLGGALHVEIAGLVVHVLHVDVV